MNHLRAARDAALSSSAPPTANASAASPPQKSSSLHVLHRSSSLGKEGPKPPPKPPAGGAPKPPPKAAAAPAENVRPDAEGLMQVVSKNPLLNRERMFRLIGPRLECISLRSNREVMMFNMLECEVKPVKETLVVEGPAGKGIVIKPQPADYDKWKYALMQACTPLLSERHQPQRVAREKGAHSLVRHSHAFEGLLMQQLESIQVCLEDQVYTADVDAVAKTVVEALADPASLARLRIDTANDPSKSRNLEQIWNAYDLDHDGVITPTDMVALVRGYLEAMRQQLPSTLRQLVATITKFFLSGKDVDAVSNQLMSSINAKLLPQAASFIHGMLQDHVNIAEDMLQSIDVKKTGKVTKEDFMNNFLHCAEFAFIDTAICAALSDEISLQLTKCLGKMWNTRPGLCGLSNLGNTCYMNAALQCLSHTAQLRKYFLSKKFISSVVSRHKDGAQLTMSFAELIREIWSGQNSTLRPHRVKRAIDEVSKQFAGWTQQDSHEFIACLLDTIHEDVNRIEKKRQVVVPDSNNRPDHEVAEESWKAHLLRENSIIVDVFHGQIKSAVTCGTCSFASVRFDAALGFSLPLPDGDGDVQLDSCMDLFTAEERLEDDNMWFCEKCKKKTSSAKQINLFRLPKCLIVHLKRFKYNVYGTVTKKLDNLVEFPVEGWDLRKWLPQQRQEDPTVQTLYDLYAVVHHFGTASVGHYTSSCKLGKTWMNFDDSNVMVGSPSGSSRSAYVLFYEQRGSRNSFDFSPMTSPTKYSSRRRRSQPTIPSVGVDRSTHWSVQHLAGNGAPQLSAPSGRPPLAAAPAPSP
eukprot:EG_transcript_3523